MRISLQFKKNQVFYQLFRNNTLLVSCFSPKNLHNKRISYVSFLYLSMKRTVRRAQGSISKSWAQGSKPAPNFAASKKLLKKLGVDVGHKWIELYL